MSSALSSSFASSLAGCERWLRRGASLVSSLDSECGVADFRWPLFGLALRSCLADESDEEDEFEVGAAGLVGIAPLVERRIGDGIARRRRPACVLRRKLCDRELYYGYSNLLRLKSRQLVAVVSSTI